MRLCLDYFTPYELYFVQSVSLDGKLNRLYNLAISRLGFKKLNFSS